MAEGRCALKLELSLVSCGLATNSSILSSSSLESTFEELEDKVRETASCFTIGFVLKGAKVRLLWTGETGPLRMSLSCLMVFSAPATVPQWPGAPVASLLHRLCRA